MRSMGIKCDGSRRLPFQQVPPYFILSPLEIVSSIATLSLQNLRNCKSGYPCSCCNDLSGTADSVRKPVIFLDWSAVDLSLNFLRSKLLIV